MSNIEIIPAIDLAGGRCVRLKQGVASAETVYSDDPVGMAKHWEAEGGTYLHVVDLDGAFEGKPMHREVVSKIVSALSIPVEIGGGIRTDEDIASLLEVGVNRVILGTRAWREPDHLKTLIDRYGSKIAVGIDARDGLVQVQGWTETTEKEALVLARLVDQAGLETLIFTDTSRDGMMQGINAPAFAAMCDAVSCSVIASGGVSSEADIVALQGLDKKNLQGAIVGKALYEGVVTIKSLTEVNSCT